MITFEVEGVPVPKGRSRFTRSGHHYTPAKTRAYEALVALRAKEAMRGQAMITGPITLALTLCMPIPKSFSKRDRERALDNEIMPIGKPDLSNLLKAIEDGMNGIVFRDDAQIVGITMVKGYALQSKAVIEIDTWG